MSDRPGLIRRFDRTGLPLLLCRLVLGVMFITLGLAKTGLFQTWARDRGYFESGILQWVSDRGLVEFVSTVDFLKLSREYELFSDAAWPVMNFMVVTLPWIETLCGLLLLLGIAVRGAAVTALLMLLGFTSIVLLRALDNPEYVAGAKSFCEICFNCGCGSGDICICRKLAMDGTLVFASLVALVSGSRRLCLMPRLAPGKPKVQAQEVTPSAAPR